MGRSTSSRPKSVGKNKKKKATKILSSRHSKQKKSRMEIFLRRDGSTTAINVYKDGVVEDIMKHIENSLKIPIDKQMLKFKEQVLKKEESLLVHDIKDGNVIRVEECIDLDLPTNSGTKSKTKTGGKSNPKTNTNKKTHSNSSSILHPAPESNVQDSGGFRWCIIM